MARSKTPRALWGGGIASVKKGRADHEEERIEKKAWVNAKPKRGRVRLETSSALEINYKFAAERRGLATIHLQGNAIRF